MKVIGSSIGRPGHELCPAASLQLSQCSNRVCEDPLQVPLVLAASQRCCSGLDDFLIWPHILILIFVIR